MEVEFINLFPQSIMLGISHNEKGVEIFLGLFALSIKRR